MDQEHAFFKREMPGTFCYANNTMKLNLYIKHRQLSFTADCRVMHDPRVFFFFLFPI